MSGMDMMLKNMLGIDPSELREQVEQFREKGEALAAHVNNKVESMDAKLTMIISNQQKMYQLMVAADLIKPVDSETPAIEAKNNGPVQLN